MSGWNQPMSKHKSIKRNIIDWKLSLLTPAFSLFVWGNAIALSQETPSNPPQSDVVQTEETATPEESAVDTDVAENRLEQAIIAEINRARTNPQGYADWLETQKQYYQGTLLKLPGEKPLRINRGLRNLNEAIAFLRQQNQLTPIDSSVELTATAQQKITAIVNQQQITNRNNLVYGKVTPEAIVMQLIVDDGFRDRRHRAAIFSSISQNAGIVCQEIAIYEQVCAIAFTPQALAVAQQADDSDTPVAVSNPPETQEQSEAIVTTNNQLPTPPEVQIAETLEPETTRKDIELTVPTESQTSIIVDTEATVTETPTAEAEKVEDNTVSDESTNNSPTTVTVETEPTSSTNTPTAETEKVENNTISDESTDNSDITVTTETTITDTPTAETEKIENNTVSNESTDNASNPNSVAVETEPTSSTDTPTAETEKIENNTVSNESTNNSPTTVAVETEPTPTETTSEIAATSSPTIERIEQGTLEEGDDVIPNDGSFYDSYPLEGKAGDSFTIILESQDFDTFLAVMDRGGNIIEQNDDISEQDSNSRLEITLSEDQEYSVIVNAYDQKGKGKYVLKVLR